MIKTISRSKTARKTYKTNNTDLNLYRFPRTNNAQAVAVINRDSRLARIWSRIKLSSLNKIWTLKNHSTIINPIKTSTLTNKRICSSSSPRQPSVRQPNSWNRSSPLSIWTNQIKLPGWQSTQLQTIKWHQTPWPIRLKGQHKANISNHWQQVSERALSSPVSMPFVRPERD